MPHTLPFLKGLGLGASLIIAIGAQNAFVLSQGIRKKHVFPIVLICSLCDTLLIIVGIGGIGSLIASSSLLIRVATWGGALFLILYGLRAFHSAFRTRVLETTDQSRNNLQSTLLATLAVSLLNPHVYLDTLVLLGSIGGQFPVPERIWFGTGAIMASFIWFFLLGYGAAYLGPLFTKPIAWRILDICIGCVMWSIALSLVFP